MSAYSNEPLVATTARRCQGCGAVEGEPAVSFKGKSGNRKRETGLPVRLVAIALADYGERQLCSRCLRGATKELRRLHEQHLAMVWGS